MSPTTPNSRCTTCRHKHLEADRVFVPKRTDPSIRQSCCPKCGGKHWNRLTA